MSTPKQTTMINSLNPNVALAGGQGFICTITGKNFNRDSVVSWNGNSRPTSYISSELLSAKITAADIADAGNAEVRVADSDKLAFTILTEFTIGGEPPAISSVSPDSVKAPGSNLTLTVTGKNFNSRSVIRCNGQDRPTQFINETKLTATLPDSETQKPSVKSISVFNSTVNFTSRSNIVAITGGIEVKSAATLSATEVANDSKAFADADGMDITAVQEVATLPLPTSIRGVSVLVIDQDHFSADALIHSVFPRRITFLVPDGIQIVPGRTTVRVTNENTDPFADRIQVGEIEPGLFSDDGSGTGLADGDVVHVINGQKQPPIPLSRAIDLSQVGANHQVLLRLNGTGLRHGGSSVDATVGNQTITAFSNGHPAGATDPKFLGMDQIIIDLPGNLASGSTAVVVTTANGERSNSVSITIA